MKQIIILDCEINGFKGKSVLSISAFKVAYDEETKQLTKLGEYDRFYFRRDGEKLNDKAIEVNGLTDEVITQKRKDVDYTETFDNDIDSFKEFCGDAKKFIAHNIDFDKSFLPFELEDQFCTMKTNTNILKLPKKRGSGFKWPKLIETVKFYKIPIDTEKLHNSLYDIEMTFNVFKEMLKSNKTKNLVEWFLNK